MEDFTHKNIDKLVSKDKLENIAIKKCLVKSHQLDIKLKDLTLRHPSVVADLFKVRLFHDSEGKISVTHDGEVMGYRSKIGFPYIDHGLKNLINEFTRKNNINCRKIDY